jgi:hypothetical protein
MSAIVWFSNFQHGIPLRALFFSTCFWYRRLGVMGDGNGTVLVFPSWSRFAAVAPVKSNQAFGGQTGRGNWRSRLKLRFDLVGMGSHELQPLERIRKIASDLSRLLPVGQDVIEKVYKYHDWFTEGGLSNRNENWIVWDLEAFCFRHCFCSFTLHLTRACPFCLIAAVFCFLLHKSSNGNGVELVMLCHSKVYWELAAKLAASSFAVVWKKFSFSVNESIY